MLTLQGPLHRWQLHYLHVRCDVAPHGTVALVLCPPKMPAFHQQLRMVAVVSAFEACRTHFTAW
jgi:hypothetical protein